jgi:hypothetical protein
MATSLTSKTVAHPFAPQDHLAVALVWPQQRQVPWQQGSDSLRLAAVVLMPIQGVAVKAVFPAPVAIGDHNPGRATWR